VVNKVLLNICEHNGRVKSLKPERTLIRNDFSKRWTLPPVNWILLATYGI
jgi:hypothetical protein